MPNSSSWRKSACPAWRHTCNSLTSHYQSALSLRFLPHAGVGRQAWTWKSFTPIKFPICLHPFYTCRHRRPTLWPCFAALLSGLGMSQAWYAWRGAVLPTWGGDLLRWGFIFLGGKDFADLKQTGELVKFQNLYLVPVCETNVPCSTMAKALHQYSWMIHSTWRD